MKPKHRGWLEGIITQDLMTVGGSSGHRAGDIVRYKRIKTIPDRDGFKLTDYEWHYVDQNNFNLVRTTEIIIVGVPYFKEPYLNTKKINNYGKVST